MFICNSNPDNDYPSAPLTTIDDDDSAVVTVDNNGNEVVIYNLPTNRRHPHDL